MFLPANALIIQLEIPFTMRINTTQTTNCFAMVKLASRVICNYQNTLFQTSIVGVIFSAYWCAEFDAGKHSLSEVGMTTDDICSHPKFKDNVINTFFDSFVAGR